MSRLCVSAMGRTSILGIGGHEIAGVSVAQSDQVPVAWVLAGRGRGPGVAGGLTVEPHD